MAEKTTVETKIAEEVKEVATKTAPKKAATTKKATTKTTAKKETAEKKETTAKKATAKKATAKAAVDSQIFIQTSYCEIAASEVIEKALNAYKEEGNKTKAKNINVYIKPEENAAYYVVNDKIAGRVDIF